MQLLPAIRPPRVHPVSRSVMGGSINYTLPDFMQNPLQVKDPLLPPHTIGIYYMMTTCWMKCSMVWLNWPSCPQKSSTLTRWRYYSTPTLSSKNFVLTNV